jgi:arabinogalactan endo-1,4-beta-galactosidase
MENLIMKSKVKTMIFAFGLFACACGASLYSQSLGDVNNDGSISIVDALLIAQYYVGLNPQNFDSANADVNCSGAIDIVDGLVIAQYYVGLISVLPCSATAAPTQTPVTTSVPTQAPTNPPDGFVKGADAGWLQQMESQGIKFYDDAGVQKDCLQILKEHGINSIRLRTWVNPSDGWCNKDNTIIMAKRLKDMGFKFMLDFHYADSWADPGKQPKPAAWTSLSFADLLQKVYDYTYDVMNSLKAQGIYPEWVQVGNETNDGMLWEDGRASKSMSNFTQIINRGYDAVKAVSPSSQVIVHISNGYDNSLFRWIFDGLKNNGGKYDIIGMSIYPTTSDWSTLNSQCLTNMNDMKSRYGKPSMIVEIGMEYTAASTCKSFITDIIAKVKQSGNNGVFYWEPECYNWQGYTKGAWNTNGRPTEAMDAFIP